MTRSPRWLLCACLALVIVGCGRGRAGVSPDTGAQLEPRVAEIRALATARQPDQVTAKLADLRRLVADLRSRDELTAQAAQAVLAAADAVGGQLVLITTTTTTTAAPPTTDSTISAARSDKGAGPGKGHGKHGGD